MENEVLQNIWNLLTSEGLTDSSFEDWVVNISEDEAVQQNVYNYLSDKNLTDSDLDTWLTNTGLKKKRRNRNRYGIRIGSWWLGVTKYSNFHNSNNSSSHSS